MRNRNANIILENIKKGIHSISKHIYIFFLFRLRENSWSFLFQVVDKRISGIRHCHRRIFFISTPDGQWFAHCVFTNLRRIHTYPILSSNIYTHTTYALQYMQRYKRSSVPFPLCRTWPFSLIHLDVIARFMETLLLEPETCDQVWRVREEVGRETKRGRNDQKTKSLFRVRGSERARMWIVHVEAVKKKKEKERTVHNERKKEGSELSWKKRERDTVGRKREKRREERGEEGEFILAAMMVVVSELAIKRTAVFSLRIPYLFSSRNATFKNYRGCCFA